MPSAENDVVQAERNDIERHENWKLSIERERTGKRKCEKEMGQKKNKYNYWTENTIQGNWGPKCSFCPHINKRAH